MKDDDFKLLRGFDDGRTDGRTFVIVESLLRLIIIKNLNRFCCTSYSYDIEVVNNILSAEAKLGAKRFLQHSTTIEFE